MTTYPSVSVVIATHHRPELLRRAIDAVLAQAYDGSVECVVVYDQAPVDESIAGPAVKVVANDRTAGLAGARNAGIAAARGDLIAFCDDDDEWLPGKLRLQAERLESAGADVVVSGIEVHYEDRVVVRVPSASDLAVAELARRRVMEAHPSTVLVRRSALLDRIGLVDEEIPGAYGEDYDWILRAASEAGPIAVVEQPLVKVRWGSHSYFQQRWRTIIAALDYMVHKHPVLSADPRGLARLIGQQAFAYAALGAKRTALRFAWRAFRLSWKEQRAYVALVVALRLVTADRVLRLAHSRGRGI